MLVSRFLAESLLALAKQDPIQELAKAAISGSSIWMDLRGEGSEVGSARRQRNTKALSSPLKRATARTFVVFDK